MAIESWIIAISIGVIALAFVVLAVFLILMLMSIRTMVKDLDQKVHAFDPLFRLVERAGCAVDRKASKINKLEKEIEEEIEECNEGKSRQNGRVNTVMEVAEWALIGLTLWQKIREKRR